MTDKNAVRPFHVIRPAPDAPGSRACFQRVFTVAGAQDGTAWELRAVLSLARQSARMSRRLHRLRACGFAAKAPRSLGIPPSNP